jgi:hypothetical protein
MNRRCLLTAVGVAAASLALAAQGQTNARFRFQRSVEVTAPGSQRLDVDVALLAGAQPFTVTQRGERAIAAGGLNDLRLFLTPGGAEVPYLLVPPSPDAPSFASGRILPVAATEKTSGFEVDLGETFTVDALDLSRLRGPFLKRFLLEGSGDRERWTQLVAEGTAFDLPAEQLRHTRIPFAAGEYRYLRITWDDTNSGRVAPPDAASARRVTVSSPGPILRAPLAIAQRPSEPGRSRFRITLPAARLPIVALELTVGGGHLSRDARVLEAGIVGQEAQPRVIGQATLTRIVRDQVTAEALRIPIRPPAEPQLELVVDDGDNPGLELTAVTAVFAELPWIYFESQPASLTASFGDPRLAAPRYDLEAARATIPSAPVRAAWGSAPAMTLAPEPEGLPMPDTGSALDTAGFAYMREIPAGPAGLISVPLDAAVMSHSGVSSRGLRDLRVVDRAGFQVPYLLEKRDEPLVLDARVERRTLPTVVTPPPLGTSYVVHIPFADLPSARIVFTTRARVFERTLTLGQVVPATDRTPARFQRLDGSRWVHADDATAASPLTFSLPESRRGDLFLVVEEGDNQPLPIEKATVVLPSYAIRLFRRPDLPLRLVYGKDAIAAPRYDLQLLSPQLMGRVAADVTAGPEQPFSPAGPSPTAPAVPPTVFWSALALAVVVLLTLVVRLMRREAEQA